MATKYYLTNDTAPYTPATIRGAWDDTAGAVTKALETSPRSGANTQVVVAELNVAAEYDVLLYRGVSGPLAAQTISGTVDVLLGVWESNAAAEFHYHLHLYVTQGDSDTPRGDLLTDYREALGVNEWPTVANSSGRALNAAQALSSLAVTAGDRLVLEIGYTARNIVTTSRSGALDYGYIKDGPDLAVNGNPDIANGTITFSATLAEVPQVARVTQLVAETVSPVSVAVRVTQIVVETVSQLTEAAAITTTRTDRAVFPTNAVIGDADLPLSSVLRLGTLPARTPGEAFLSVDAGGEVTAGPLDASELPPAAFTIEPESLTRRARPRAPTTPQGAVRGMYRYGWSPQTTAPPSNATVRVNAAFPHTDVTLLWADYDSSQSEDLYWGWLRLVVGSSVFIQDKDNHLQYLELETTAAPIDRGGYVEVPVRYVAGGEALAVQECLIGAAAPVVAAPVGLTGTYVVTWFSPFGPPVGRLSLTFEQGLCVDLHPLPTATQLPIFPPDEDA